MPNISFDVFFDNDVLNFTASRSGGVPKIKPGWKVRTAPKLAPKEKPEEAQAAKPNRPAPKAVPKPTIQGKTAPPKVVPPKQTIKANSGAPRTAPAAQQAPKAPSTNKAPTKA